MKLRKMIALFTVALAAVTFGCRPESVGPKAGGGDAGHSVSSSGHGCSPTGECNSWVGNLVAPDFNNQPTGSVFITNNNEKTYVCFSPNVGQVVGVALWYADDKTVLPLDDKGMFDPTQFSYMESFEMGQSYNYVTIEIPMKNIWQCNNLAGMVITKRVGRTGTITYYNWMVNGAFDPALPADPARDMLVSYCNVLCTGAECEPWRCATNPCDPTQNAGCLGSLDIVCEECAMVLPEIKGLGAAKLTVDGVDGGVAPFTYLWNTGETTQTIRVTPNVTSTYTVTVTDAQGAVGVRHITVNALNNISCSNGKKVKVCYSPPDKPNTWVEKCVDAKKVGSYVPKLRYSDQGSGSKGKGSVKGSGSIKIKSSGSNKFQSVKAHASIKVKSAHSAPSVKGGSKAKKVGGSHFKGGSQNASLKAKSGKGKGVASLIGSVGSCGANGPVNPPVSCD